jgi:hypothetical protein
LQTLQKRPTDTAKEEYIPLWEEEEEPKDLFVFSDTIEGPSPSVSQPLLETVGRPLSVLQNMSLWQEA